MKVGDILQPVNALDYGTTQWYILKIYRDDKTKWLKRKDRKRLDLRTVDGSSTFYNATYSWWKKNARIIK